MFTDHVPHNLEPLLNALEALGRHGHRFIHQTFQGVHVRHLDLHWLHLTGRFQKYQQVDTVSELKQLTGKERDLACTIPCDLDIITQT